VSDDEQKQVAVVPDANKSAAMDLVVQSHNQDKDRLCAIINEQRAQFNEVFQQAVAKMADNHKMMVEALLSKEAAAAEERQRLEAERQRKDAAAAAERQAAAEERQRKDATLAAERQAAAEERQRLEAAAAAAAEERKTLLAALMAQRAVAPPVPPPPPAPQQPARRVRNNDGRVRLPYKPVRPLPMLARQFPVYDKQPYSAFKNAVWFTKAMRKLQRGPPFVIRGDVLCTVNEEGYKLRHVHLHPTLAAAVDRHFAE
jgi:hypothetical protein